MLKKRATDKETDDSFRNRNDKFLGARFEFWKWLGILTITIIFTAGIYYAKLQAMDMEQKAQACELSRQKEKETCTEQKVAVLESKLDNIDKKTDELKKGNDRILNYLLNGKKE